MQGVSPIVSTMLSKRRPRPLVVREVFVVMRSRSGRVAAGAGGGDTPHPTRTPGAAKGNAQELGKAFDGGGRKSPTAFQTSGNRSVIEAKEVNQLVSQERAVGRLRKGWGQPLARHSSSG